MSTTPTTVFVDADNTLWDTDSVFAEAQLALLAEVEKATTLVAPAGDRLGYVRTVDQAIAERHHAGLRYPPKLLVRGLGLALAGETGEAAARAAWSGHLTSVVDEAAEASAEQAFFAALRRPPRLRPGVVEGMATLRQAGTILLIISEGARAKVQTNAERLGLRDYFTRIIEGAKRPELYRRILRLTGAPETAFMIGDQLDRDIIPAKQAGLRTIYFPGGFVPRWTADEGEAAPDYRISDFREAAAIIRDEGAVESGSRAVAGR